MPEAILHVESRPAARAKNVQMVQHVFAALILIGNGWTHLRHASHLEVLPLLEVIAGATLVVFAAREKLRRGHGHERVAWLELAGAAMMFVEAVGKTQERHHLSFKILQFLPAVVLLLLGLFEARVGTHYLKATDDGLTAKFRRFRWKRFAWSDMSSYRVDGTRFTFTQSNGGTRKLDLRAVRDRDAAVAWTLEQLAAHEVPCRQGEAGKGEPDE